MLASDFPLQDLMMSMLFFAVWFVVLYVLFRIIKDIFQSPDLGGVSKVLWLLFVIAAPVVGFIVYVVVREHLMGERARREALEERKRSGTFRTWD